MYEPKAKLKLINTGVRSFTGSAHLALMVVSKTARTKGVNMEGAVVVTGVSARLMRS